jgi:hypothetical protein
MSSISRRFAPFSDFLRPFVGRWLLAAVFIAALAAMPDVADAARARRAAGGNFDGTWNVAFTPRAGNCSSTYSAPFIISGTRVSSGGGGKVTGGVSRNGAVSVTISVGASVASGRGRLAGNSGAGNWSGIITGDRCSGVWQASRG